MSRARARRSSTTPSLLSSGATAAISILELAQPRWKGKLGFAPSETDFQPLLTAIVKLDGDSRRGTLAQGPAVANSKVYPDNETVVTQVNNGRAPLGPIDHYYWYRLRDELGSGRASLRAALLRPGRSRRPVDVSGAAVLGSSAHRAAAQAFLAFLVSRAGQERSPHSHSYEYPLRPGVSPAAGAAAALQLAGRRR